MTLYVYSNIITPNVFIYFLFTYTWIHTRYKLKEYCKCKISLSSIFLQLDWTGKHNARIELKIWSFLMIGSRIKNESFLRSGKRFCRSPFEPPKAKNDPFIKLKSKVRIEGNKENKFFSAIWADLKNVFEP